MTNNAKIYIMILEYLSKNTHPSLGQSADEYMRQLEHERDSLGQLQRILRDRLETIAQYELNLRCAEGGRSLRSTVCSKKMGKFYHMPYTKGHEPVQ